MLYVSENDNVNFVLPIAIKLLCTYQDKSALNTLWIRTDYNRLVNKLANCLPFKNQNQSLGCMTQITLRWTHRVATTLRSRAMFMFLTDIKFLFDPPTFYEKNLSSIKVNEEILSCS